MSSNYMNSGYENAANSYGDDQWRKAPHDEYYVGPASRGDAYQETSAADFSNGGARSRPQFFNSKKGDVKPEAYPEPQYNVRKREEKGEVRYMPDELKEESLTREVKTHNGKLAEYKVTSGEFENFPEVHPKTIEKLKLRGITSLFPIQYHSFYPIFNREDVIARDLTGSGKTLGFALPVVEFFRKQKVLGQRKIQAIVLAPTRELAIQVSNEFSRLKHSEDEYKTLTVYGGVSIEDQTRELRRGVDFFVGTTGRVLDHIERGNIDFTHLKSIILDEADQMLKLGFKEDVEKIMRIIKSQCKQGLQICMFSATIPRWVKAVAEEYLNKNYRIVDLAQNLSNKTSKTVNHLAINCPYHNRMAALADILVTYGGDGKVIVFTQTKADANSLILSDKIKQDIEAMHGDIAQNQREVTMKRFKEGKFNVLVATDVASRGLDIPDVDLVIQIEPPKEVETYIHRSGRTARAGKAGTCITFYMKKTAYMISQIEQQAGIKFKTIGVPQPEDVIRASSRGIIKNLDNVNSDVLPLFIDTARDLIERCGGDPEVALSTALAYISGHYKQALISRSLLTGQENSITIELKSTVGRFPNATSAAWGILKKYWPMSMTENIKGMRAMKDNTGVVFDIYENHRDRFLEIYNHLQYNDSSVAFYVEKCKELPELVDESGFDNSGGWGDRSGGYQRGGRQTSFGGYSTGGSYGQRGGFNRQASGSYGYRGGYSSYNTGGGQDWRGGHADQGYYMKPRMNQYAGGDTDSNHSKSSFGYQTPYTAPKTVTPSSYQAYAPQAQAPQSDNTVYIRNLSYNTKEEDLRNFFLTYNLSVGKIKLLVNEQGQSKGSSIVEFSDPLDAAYAVKELSGVEYDASNRKIVIDFARNNRAQGYQRSQAY